MSRRVTVSELKIACIESFLGTHGWSNAFFSETLMKKGRGWVSEWKRGKNLPSPEEAAQMCVLLQTTPEEILVKPEDIALVNSLLEQEKGIKKQPAANSDEPDKKALLDIVKSSDDEAFLLSVLQEVSKKLQEKHHGD